MERFQKIFEENPAQILDLTTVLDSIPPCVLRMQSGSAPCFDAFVRRYCGCIETCHLPNRDF